MWNVYSKYVAWIRSHLFDLDETHFQIDAVTFDLSSSNEFYLSQYSKPRRFQSFVACVVMN